MKKLITTMALAAISICSYAQNGGKISGSIKDGGQQQVIDAASISLLNASDSSIVKTSIADKDGNFIFEHVKNGSYLVSATSIGYARVYSSNISIDENKLTAETGTLQLVPVNKSLEAVVVTAKKMFVERKIDKTVINPDALISNTGTTALEVLEKSPGITVDKDGNISMRGKNGVIIMLDGKPSYLAGAELVNYLSNLPSSSLDQIELMTNPSAKYDASGNSGIINIKTKKNRQKGFNGSAAFAYGQGIYPKTNNSLSLNYKVGKINLFSNFSANYRENVNRLDINRVYGNDDKTVRAIFDQKTSTYRQNENYNAKIGMDFYATKKTTIGVVLQGYTAPEDEQGNSISLLQSPAGRVDSIVTANTSTKSSWRNGSVNLNLRHTFDSTGRELSVDVDYLRYKTDRNQRFLNGTYNPDFSAKYSDVLLGLQPSEITIYSAKADYTHPFQNGLKMETGVKTSYVETDNAAQYFNVVGGNNIADFSKTNHFTYKENINAAYVNFSKNIKKWGLQLGLRAENTNYEGLQFGNPTRNDSAFKRSYVNLFPTTYVSYNMNDKNTFGISVGRRINRPDYESLNPFLFFIDKYTYEEGNPFLKPMYSNVLELSHTYNQFLTTTLNYSHTTDRFNETFRQNNQPNDSISTIVSRNNYGIVNNLSLAINAQIKVAKWYTLMAYAESQYMQVKANLNGDVIDYKTISFVANVNNQFTFSKGWSAELSAFFRTKSREAQMTIHALAQMDAAVKKDVLKGKGSVRLGVRDVTGPMHINGNIDFQNTRVKFYQSRDTRVITLGFNYRFGKPIKGLKNRRSGGTDQEQNRIKSAN